MAVSDWSIDPAQNSFIDGINIGENCPGKNLNDGLRAVMASVRVAFNGVSRPSGDAYVTKSNAVFFNQPTLQGRGALIHHNDAANASGRIFVQAVGGAVPAGMQNGDILLEY